MKPVAVLICVSVLCLAATASATVIDIPGDYPTIQQGINNSSDGDTVLVQPGRYEENIDFLGKDIVVGSIFLTTRDLQYVSSTIIDAGMSGTAVVFQSGESGEASLIGFSVINGSNPFGGGILCAANSSPSISYSIIKQNLASQGGGGIACLESTGPLITNSLFYLNYTDAYGGGIYCDTDSKLRIINCVVCNNQSMIGGGGLASTQSGPMVINCIFWNNCGPGFGSEIVGTATASYSDIAGGWEGEGNIDENPLFRDYFNGNYHLMSTTCGDSLNSPCIDAGDPSLDDVRLDCDWGLESMRSDMGAYGGGSFVPTGIDDFSPRTPVGFAVNQNYPNPFNASTAISYDLPERSEVKVAIYNIVGQKVAVLFAGSQPAGHHTMTWRADRYPSGVYFARLETEAHNSIIKMTLLK